jgi:hypothetical protein
METTRTLLVELVRTLTAQYAAQLEQMPMQKRTREVLVDGFRDGAREGTRNLCAMLDVTIKEE